MNLMWHIMRKDINRCRWSLVCWLCGLTYLFMQSPSRTVVGNLMDWLQFSAVMVVTVLGIGMIADILQSDHPTLENSHWRTLPISPRRMAAAKLLLIAGLFVALPVAATWLTNLATAFSGVRFPREYGMIALILAALSLTLAASAACTRNVLHCVLLWMALLFGAGSLASYLTRFAPVLSPRSLSRMGMDKALAILSVSVVIALAVILNQYVRRRPAASAFLLLAGAVCTALIGTFWGYFYFYRA